MASRTEHYETFIDGQYAHTSASQAKNWLQCPRIWYADKVLKIKKPTTEAMLRGTAIHEAIEHYLLTGEVLDCEWAEYVEAAREHLDPLVKAADTQFVVEGKMLRETFFGGPKWLGYKDLEIVQHNPHAEVSVRILDYKSTSDRKYAKTPAELSEDLQLNSYAKQTFDDRPNLKTIRLGHLYLLTKNKKKIGWTVWTEVDREQVEKVWARTLNVVREIMDTVKVMGLSGDKFEDLTPNTDSCGMYGGCFFRNRCGIGGAKVNFSVESLLRKKPTGEKMPSLSEKLKAKTNGAKFAVDIPFEPATMAQLSIVPPDAPPRNEFPPEEAEAKPTKAAKPKKGSTLNLDEFKTPEAPVEVKTPAALGRKKLVLLEGCVPLKGPYKEYTLLADWVAPLMQAVADDHGVADYRLIQFTSRAALATKIRENVASVPEVLVIGGFEAGASEAMEVLTPHATMVIRALK